MKSLSGVGLAMSLVFGFLLMALLAELYYLLWWKRRIANARIEDGAAKEFFFMFCGKNPPPPPSLTMKPPLEVSRPDNLVRHEPQPRTDTEEEEEEAELMRLSGPARFLCTIKEETMEDLESDDGRKWRMETPYFTPPLTPDKRKQCRIRAESMRTEKVLLVVRKRSFLIKMKKMVLLLRWCFRGAEKGNLFRSFLLQSQALLRYFHFLLPLQASHHRPANRNGGDARIIQFSWYINILQ
nr:Optomotor-blind protein [Ipomoea batatas]